MHNFPRLGQHSSATSVSARWLEIHIMKKHMDALHSISLEWGLAPPEYWFQMRMEELKWIEGNLSWVNVNCWIIEFLIYRRLREVHVGEGREREGWLPVGDSDSPPEYHTPHTTDHHQSSIHHTPTPPPNTNPPGRENHTPLSTCAKPPDYLTSYIVATETSVFG